MSLVPVRSAGLWYLRNVVADTSVLAPLGRFYWQIGPHYLGIDDSFEEPVIARAYYDPSQDTTGHRMPMDAFFSGYIQFLRIRFGGIAVPPDAYGGHLADRAPYVSDELTFVDFMGPADALARADRESRKLDPFYAFNGALLADYQNYRQLAPFPRRNGSLLLGAGDPVDNQAQCASLVAELVPGLVTADHIGALLNRGNRLREIPCLPADLAFKDAYRIALDDMSRRGELPGLTYSDLVGTVVGKYALVALPNEEEMRPCVCVYAADDNRSVQVHILAYHEVDSARQAATMDSLLRLSEYIVEYEESRAGDVEMGGVEPPDPVPTRGGSGLYTVPVTFEPGSFAVEWEYTTYMFAQIPVRRRRSNPFGDLRPMHGFTWTVCQRFDADTRTLSFTSVGRPRDAGSFGHQAALLAYYGCLNHFFDTPGAAPRIDVSNFTLADMRLRDMGAGVKISGITAGGDPANNDDGSPT
jgi:hypothetical protein